MQTQPSMAQVFSDLTTIEKMILNSEMIPKRLLESIKIAQQVTLAFELLNMSSIK